VTRPVPWFAVETLAVTLALGDTLAINPLNAAELLAAFGMIGVLAIIFAETGLLIGFFFPGDSLLFLAGIAASPFANDILPGVQMNIWVLLIGAPICAIAGAQLGHLLGARYGRKLFHKPNSRIFKPEYVDKAEYYFNKFGPAKAVILARFIPIVRTFLNPVAGVLEMPARQFFVYNLVGGLLWTDGILLIGYFVAKQITKYIPASKIDSYLLPVIILIVFISAIPIFVEIFRNWREKRNGGGPAGPTAKHGSPDSAAADVPRHRA
jgi:membrane-associated protein